VATGNLDKAAIFNSEGDSVWATSAGFVVSPAETKEIVSAYKDKADVKQVQSSGLHIAGEKFVVLRADDRSIYGKKVRSADLLGKTCSIATEQSMLPASLRLYTKLTSGHCITGSRGRCHRKDNASPHRGALPRERTARRRSQRR
jgi:hypothetical protein